MDNVLVSTGLFSKKCRHNKFLVDPQLAEVECGLCGEKLNPMWALHQLCDREARARAHLERLEELVEKTKDKLRCKCQHCEKMTRIYR